MSDIEITRLCAEAMGYGYSRQQMLYLLERNDADPSKDYWGEYEPLTDDAQAMALVKKFELSIAWSWAHQISVMPKPKDENPIEHRCTYTNLNRAICECVAKMHSLTRGE